MKTALMYTMVLVLGIAAVMGVIEARAMERGGSAPLSALSEPAICPPSRPARKRIGLVAHDACKKELLAWVEKNAALLAGQDLYCTGTTGRLVLETLASALPGGEINLTRFNSGPLGGDLQMGALVAQDGLDILVFFVDPLTAHPHDADVKALLRICGVSNTVLATNPATADYVVTSPFFTGEYVAAKPDYASYVNRQVK